MVNQMDSSRVYDKNDIDVNAILELARKSHEQYLIKFQREYLDEAIDYYISAIKMNPNLSETYYRLATLLWDNGQISLSAAIEQCQSAVSISPENPNARIYTAYFLNMAGKYDEAEKEFKKAIELNPLKSARPRLSLAMMLLNKMKTDKISFREFSKSLYYLLSGSMTLPLDKPSLKMIYKNCGELCAIKTFEAYGKILEKFHKYPDAIRTYDIAAEKTGREELFFSKIGDISIQNEAPEIALDSYLRALDANPNNCELLAKIATVIQTYFDEKIDTAIDCYTRILEIAGQDERVYYELGHLYLKKDDSINAVNAFKLALSLALDNPFYHNSLGYALVQMEQYDEAIEHYQIAINLNPDNEWTSIVCQALATIQHKVKENSEAAVALYQMALVLNPACEDSYISIGDIHFENNETELAIKAYCDAISANPENPKAYSKCGMALWEADYVDEAIVAYNKAIALDPEYDVALNNLGVVYLDGIGNINESIFLFQDAVALNPDYTLAYFNLGRAYQAIGDKIRAAENYQIAADLNEVTSDVDADDLQRRIYSLFETD